ncbi:MAG: hypothetical protein ACRC2T_00440 [Thermoguttaceae bacterium]
MKNSGKEPTNGRRNSSREAHRPYRAPVYKFTIECQENFACYTVARYSRRVTLLRLFNYSALFGRRLFPKVALVSDKLDNL